MYLVMGLFGIHACQKIAKGQHLKYRGYCFLDELF
jgi:hypothetical protein